MSQSEFEIAQYELRRQKLEQIADLVAAPGQAREGVKYPNSYAATATIPQLRSAYDVFTAERLDAEPIEVSVAGRIMAIRVQGKAGFAQLQQGGQRFQIYVRKDEVGESLFAVYKLLDLGDHIGVRGHLFRTRTGELTIHVRAVAEADGTVLPALTFLAKSMIALPDKYHGLEDTELRYRQRYVDLIVNSGAVKGATAAPAPVAAAAPVADGGVDKTEALASMQAAGLAAEPVVAAPVEEEAGLNVRATFIKRAAVLRALRTYFDQRGYIEVETPMLMTIAGGAAARPFVTHHNTLDMDLSLRIAPELYLKRLVVGGFDRVYEINRNFRNEGIDTSHNPEFTMLEFYQAYSNYHELMELTEDIIKFVANEVNGTTVTQFDGYEIDLGCWTKLSMREAIVKFWQPEYGAAPSSEDFLDESAFFSVLNRASQAANKLASASWVEIEPGHNVVIMDAARSALQVRANDLNRLANECARALASRTPVLGKTISALFEILAEEQLIQPHIIYDFPLAVSPLSKQKPEEPDWVERFEFYIGGFEVGNAFSELNDPVEQEKRFMDQLKERDRGDDEAHKMDEDYVRALGFGLPPTAGEGIGIDRLTMLLTGSKSIRDVILFPLMRPVKGQAEEGSADQS